MQQRILEMEQADLRQQQEEEHEKEAKIAAIAEAERRRDTEQSTEEVVDALFGKYEDDGQQARGPRGFEVNLKGLLGVLVYLRDNF